MRGYCAPTETHQGCKGRVVSGIAELSSGVRFNVALEAPLVAGIKCIAASANRFTGYDGGVVNHAARCSREQLFHKVFGAHSNYLEASSSEWTTCNSPPMESRLSSNIRDNPDMTGFLATITRILSPGDARNA